jgi:hypothetical protein
VAAGIGLIVTFVVLSLVEDRRGDASLSDCRRQVAQEGESGELSLAYLRRLEQRCAVLAGEAASATTCGKSIWHSANLVLEPISSDESLCCAPPTSLNVFSRPIKAAPPTPSGGAAVFSGWL